MTDLLNIAKECGARENVTGINDAVLVITEAQLQATVEQVCKPLVDALTAAVDCGMVPKSSAKEGGATKHSIQVHVADQIRDCIAGHRKLMGQDK